MNKFLYLLLHFLFFFSISTKAQTDTVFWFAAPDGIQLTSDVPIKLHFTCYNQPATITVSQPSGSMPAQILTLSVNSSQSLDLTSWIDSIESKPANTILNKGLKITATANISVYYEVNENFNNPEMFVLKGRNSLGMNFLISSQNYLDNGGIIPPSYSSFNIVASENNTQVTITPSNNIIGHSASIPFTITLNQGQSYSAVATSQLAFDHLHGSYVTSTKPIAITLADDFVEGGPYGGCLDLAGDQTIPTNIIGNEYIAVKGGLNIPYDKVFLLATQNATNIYQDGTLLSTINTGQTYQVTISNPSTYINSSSPIYAYQLTGNGCEVGSAILPTINCTGSSNISFIRTTTFDLYITLLVKNGGQNNFTINGLLGVIVNSQFTAVPGTSNQWYAARIPLSIASYPTGTAIKIKNSTSLFHLGVSQDATNGGNSFGYFSDFNTFQAQATANNTNPCVGNQLQLFADTIISASYSWTGPNGFTSALQNPIINNFQTVNAGNYYLQVSIAGCSTSYDTLQITACSISNCITPQILLNTGVDDNGNLLPIGVQDSNWKVTSITNSYIPTSQSISYFPYVSAGVSAYYFPANSQYLAHSTINCLPSQPPTGPLDPVYEITRHFTTVQDDTFLVNATFLVDNYINYFKIDGVTYFSSLPTGAMWPFQNPNPAITNLHLFLPSGCHDITCSYSDWNGNTVNTQSCASINIYGTIQSLNGDSTLLKQSCVTNTPPTLTANNTINYCTNCEPVSPNLTITSGLGCGNLDTVKVYFTSGYTQGQDTLQFVPQLGINSTFNPSTGILTLFGNANYGVWETVLRTVCYSSLIPNINQTTTVKNVVICLGNALYNPANNHFYKLVNANLNWTDSKIASTNSNYFGLQGYLVTITSLQENNFISNLINSDTWIGASDSTQEGIWRWITGCEGLENSGLGRHFYTNANTGCGNIPSGTIIGGNYNDFTTGALPQPDNGGCIQHYCRFWNPSSIGYTWDDFQNIVQPNYIIEYGCMPFDPTINITGNITINILPHQDTTINKTICQGATFLGYNITGTYIDTFTSVSNCDSIRTLNLIVTPIITSIINHSICQGQTYLGYTTAGLHIDTFTNANGCDSIRTLNLTVNPLPTLSITAFPNDSICNGLFVTLTATGATTYSWTGGITNGVSFPVNATTTYTVTGASTTGCTNTATQTITNIPLPTINIASSPSPSTICNGDNIILTATGANTYSWTGGITNGISFTPTATITYTVTGTNSFGCTKTATKLVTVNPTQNFTINQSICQGQTYLGYSTVGLHIDTFTNANGCDSIRTLNLTVNPLPTLSITAFPNDSICNGLSVTLTAAGANTYSWSGGITNGVSFPVNATTTYTVTGTSTAGCTNSATQTITNVALPTINISSTPSPSIICNGNNIILTATGANTYSWSGGIANGVSFTPTATTTYTVTGTNSFGCTKTATKLVTVNSTQAFTINHSICQGQTYLGYSTAGSHIDTFANSNGCDSIRTLNLTVNAATFSNINQTICQPNSYLGYSTTGTFIDTLLNANGCDSVRTLNLIVNPKTYSTINHSICQGQTYLGYTIAGTHLDTFVNANGCDSVRTLNLTVNPLPTILIQPTTPQICNGDSITLTASGANTYSWSPSTGLNTTTNNIVIANPNTTTTYTVIGTDANNCSNSISKMLTVYNTYTKNDTATICEGSTYTFGSQNLTTAGNYSNTFSTIHGCDSIIQLKLNVIEKPIANFVVPPNICANTPIDINNTWVSATANYVWTFSGNPTINSQNGAFNNVSWNTTGTKTISVTITPTLPCLPVSFTTTTNVNSPYANITIENNDSIFCVYDKVNLRTYTNPTYKYEWNPPPYLISNFSTATAELKEPIYATVKVTDTFGCVKIDTMFLNAQPCCSAFLPNAFTPNNDNNNDEFRIIGEGNYHIFDFFIANRWGNIVFKTIDAKQGWDGKYLGVEQDMGVYFYYLKYECTNF